MNMKLRLAVVATLLLTGCQTLPNRNDAVTDEQQTAQTATKSRTALDRSESEQSRISAWRHASNQMKMEIPDNPEIISYRTLLEVLFTLHDPTQLNRQGHDVGTQYRSGIYYLDEAQKAEAQAFVQEMAAHYPQPIATEIAAAQTFHPAEAYHQHYFANNPQAGYCQMVVAPKFLKARTKYADLWRG